MCILQNRTISKFSPQHFNFLPTNFSQSFLEIRVPFFFDFTSIFKKFQQQLAFIIAQFHRKCCEKLQCALREVLQKTQLCRILQRCGSVQFAELNKVGCVFVIFLNAQPDVNDFSKCAVGHCDFLKHSTIRFKKNIWLDI